MIAIDRLETAIRDDYKVKSTGNLLVENLSVSFRTGRGVIAALRGVSFELDAGSTLVLLGESGSGKSVSARSILRLYDQSAEIRGKVMFDGVDLLSIPENQMRAIRGKDIAFVPQDATASLDPLRKIGKQLVEVLRVHDIETTKVGARERALDCLAKVGIPDPKRVANSFPHELSGGMRQRALIAIAIACSPKVLIADEPTTALDVTIQAQVLELFGQLQSDLGMGLIMVTHDVGVAAQIADRVAVMYAGRIVESGVGVDVLERPTHPYTAGLLSAVPRPGIARGHLKVIAGRPPAAGEDFGAGCAFAKRCEFAVESCTEEVPELVEVADSHFAACPVVHGEVLGIGNRETGVAHS